MVAVPVLFLVETEALKSLSCFFIFFLHKVYRFYVINHLDIHRDDELQKLFNVELWYYPQQAFSQLFLIRFLDLFLLGLLVGEIYRIL